MIERSQTHTNTFCSNLFSSRLRRPKASCVIAVIVANVVVVVAIVVVGIAFFRRPSTGSRHMHKNVTRPRGGAKPSCRRSIPPFCRSGCVGPNTAQVSRAECNEMECLRTGKVFVPKRGRGASLRMRYEQI